MLLALLVSAQLEIFAIGTETILKEPDPGGEAVEPQVSPFFDSVFYSINPNTGEPTKIDEITVLQDVQVLIFIRQKGQFICGTDCPFLFSQE